MTIQKVCDGLKKFAMTIQEQMQGFFLPQPASWPGTPFAPIRMTGRN
jgi:hypothetical protein